MFIAEIILKSEIGKKLFVILITSTRLEIDPLRKFTRIIYFCNVGFNYIIL